MVMEAAICDCKNAKNMSGGRDKLAFAVHGLRDFHSISRTGT